MQTKTYRVDLTEKETKLIGERRYKQAHNSKKEMITVVALFTLMLAVTIVGLSMQWSEIMIGLSLFFPFAMMLFMDSRRDKAVRMAGVKFLEEQERHNH